MVLAYHLIWTAYGFWLPNDPRGSCSHVVRCKHLEDLGELHYERKIIQPSATEMRHFLKDAKAALVFEQRVFNEQEIELIAKQFAEVMRKRNYTCYACAVMPDHIHLLIRRHRDKSEEMIEQFQSESRNALIGSNMRRAHPVWGGTGWRVYLNSPAAIEAVIRYIENNPLKAGLPAQIWPFVKRYER